ncbi:MAG: tetratricopeptide repeat protein [Planctomycetota bacterium]|nr:tetratricopeptide repeat protein [Planctomycetota bacterium]
MKQRLAFACTGLLAIVAIRCDRHQPTPVQPAATQGVDIPDPTASDMEARVRACVDTARRAVQSKPESALAWGEFGTVCDAHSFHEAAVVCYQQARTLAPRDFRWAYFAAIVADELGEDSVRVKAAFDVAIGLRPNYAPAHCRLADAMAQRGLLDSARAAYSEALRIEPDFATGHRGLGQVYLSLDDTEKAVKHLEKALDLAPSDGASLSAIAQAHRRAGRHEHAERAAELARRSPAPAVMHDPVRDKVARLGVSSTLCFRRAHRLMFQKRYVEAIENLGIVEEVLPREPKVKVLLADALAKSGKVEQAIDLLSEAVKDRNDAPSMHLRLADLLMTQERAQESMAQFRKAVAIRPEDSKIRSMLASALAQRGDLEGANREFERAAKNGRLDAIGFYNWGCALRQQGDSDNAAGRFSAALKLRPRYANAHYQLGMILEKLGRRVEAIDHYRAAVTTEPRHPASRRLKALGSGTP